MFGRNLLEDGILARGITNVGLEVVEGTSVALLDLELNCTELFARRCSAINREDCENINTRRF